MDQARSASNPYPKTGRADNMPCALDNVPPTSPGTRQNTAMRPGCAASLVLRPQKSIVSPGEQGRIRDKHPRKSMMNRSEAFGAKTIRKEKNQNLESLPSLLLDSATRTAIIATDMHGVITLFNRGAEMMLGYTAEEMVGRHTAETILLQSGTLQPGREPTETCGNRVCGFDDLAEQACSYDSDTSEWVYVRKDGSHVPVELSITSIKDDNSQDIGFLAIGMDRTPRIRIENQLKESESTLQAIIGAAVDGILTINGAGTIHSVNRSAARIFGYAREDMIGSPVTMLMPEPHRSEHDQYIRNYLETGITKIIGKAPRQVEGKRKDGTLIPLELSVAVADLDDKTVFVGILRDITERKRAQQRLMDAHAELMKKQALLDQDLRAAGAIQQSLLPQHLSGITDIEIDWNFLPSAEIGGDIFNVIPLAPGKFAFYILDVSGHGVPSSLVSVAVSQALSPGTGLLYNRNGAPRAVSDVLARLERLFPLERFDKYFSIFFMKYDVPAGKLTYSNAGQTPPILLRPDGTIGTLETGGTMIGLGEIIPHVEGEVHISPGDMLLIYTDGCIEHENPEGQQYGPERLERNFKNNLGKNVDDVVGNITKNIIEFGNGKSPIDDMTIVCIKFI